MSRSTSTTKDELRAQILEKRRKMAFEEVLKRSRAVEARLVASDYFRRASRLALYSSCNNEVLTDDIFSEAVSKGKEVFYPRVAKGERRLEFFRVEDLNELSPGAFSVLEPHGERAKEGPGFFDLVVVPGVAFDLSGGRLGYGKGYYDSSLAGSDCKIVALAYDFQIVDVRIPLEPHDVKVSAIAAQSGFYEI